MSRLSIDAAERVDVDGATLAVSDQGAGRPVLLIHAYPMRRQLYADVAPMLMPDHRVIACDNRGFGESTVSPGCVPMSQYADDLAAVLDALNVSEPAIVCGVSMGGYIAMQFAERHPDRVAGLLLCNTRTASDTAEAAAKRESLAAKIESEGASVCRSVPEKLLGSSTQESRPDLTEQLREWILDTDPRGIAGALRGMATRPDSTELIRTFDRPVHFIAGCEDSFTPFDEMIAIATAAGRGITVLERCGHLSPIEQPEAWGHAFKELADQTC